MKYELSHLKSLFPESRLIVDATSAFGASNYADDLESIDAISFCSNKCLQSTPGLGIVIWRKSLATFQRNYYCSLSRYTQRIPPFTVPVQSVYALHSVLKENEDNKILFDARRDKLIKDLAELNIECLSIYPCNSIIGFKHPSLSYDALCAFLLAKDIVIYNGIAGIEKSFRVATMSVDFDERYNEIKSAFYESIR